MNQKELTDLALQVAIEMGYNLDFTHQSIRQVDKILGSLHEQWMQDGNTEGLDGLALEFAAYIVSVVQLQTGKGEWKRDHEKFGKDSFPLFIDRRIIFPYVWCKKRIYDGEVDNLWSKYEELVIRYLQVNGDRYAP